MVVRFLWTGWTIRPVHRTQNPLRALLYWSSQAWQGTASSPMCYMPLARPPAVATGSFLTFNTNTKVASQLLISLQFLPCVAIGVCIWKVIVSSFYNVKHLTLLFFWMESTIQIKFDWAAAGIYRHFPSLSLISLLDVLYSTTEVSQGKSCW